MFWDNIKKKNDVQIIQTSVVFVKHLGSFYVLLLLAYLEGGRGELFSRYIHHCNAV